MMISASSQGRIGGYKTFFHAFFLFHSSILEPNFHLCFIELKSAGNFNSSGSGQVLVEVELLLQLGQLLGGEVGSPCVVDAPRTRLATVAAVRIGLRN